MENIPELTGKIYFVSDLHLGVPDYNSSLVREKKFVQWLELIRLDAQALFIVGDLFDFWFEYAEVVPRGYVRVLGKLAELTDNGLPVHFFTGNHDQWMKDYFTKELNIPVYHSQQQLSIAGKNFLIAHGDGLGKGDHGYKFLKSLFRGRLSRWLFSRIHPNLGVHLGRYWSLNNRLISGEDAEFLGEPEEWLIGYARKVLKNKHVDYFIFGHRHLAIDYLLNETSHYINLGDWIRYYSYAVFDGENLELKYYK
ncbi:MAG: UDP-2,3-diacylglucosamine diphosphatase [Chitinophagales bacterium]|nr:UDP-2,3-diacylglucosamine diphosphatase [Chitinophagales bacterium]